MDSGNDAYACLVCGYPWDFPPVTPGSNSDEICPCCDFQYGYTDMDKGYTYESWRAKWIAERMQFSFPEVRPSGWDPTEQLRRAGLLG